MENSGTTRISASNSLNNYTTNTVTISSPSYGEKKLVDVIIKDTSIEIVYRQTSNVLLATWPPQASPDRVWKEIFGLKDSKMTLLEVRNGKHMLPQHIPESFEFDDD